jgi:hypothetical protein
VNGNRKLLIKGALMAVGLAALCFIVWKRSANIGQTRAGLGHSFELDMEKYMDVDPLLVTYAETEPIRLDLKEPSSLAAGAGKIYVGGSGIIAVFDEAGRPSGSIAVEGLPLSLAVDAQLNVFAGVGNHIEVFDAAGVRKAVWAPPADNAIPVSIALRGEDVLVGEARRGEVLRYDRSGVQIDSITGFVLFSSPALGLAVDSRDRLWAVNPGAREIRCYKPDGSLDSSWNRPGRAVDAFSGCCNPVDIALLPDGSIVTSEKNIVRVKVVSPGGELLGVVAGPLQFDQSITELDVEVDSNGRVLVLDPVRSEVRIFASKQEQHGESKNE